MLYKLYVTDSFRAAYNLNIRYADEIITEPRAVKQTETSEEIISRICKKIEEL